MGASTRDAHPPIVPVAAPIAPRGAMHPVTGVAAVPALLAARRASKMPAVDETAREEIGSEVAERLSEMPAETMLVAAGGLRPDNVAEAASILRPQVVDVSSGVERAPGVKDHDAVRAFVAAVRALGT